MRDATSAPSAFRLSKQLIALAGFRIDYDKDTEPSQDAHFLGKHVPFPPDGTSASSSSRGKVEIAGALDT